MDEVSRVIGALEAGQAAQEKQHLALAAKVDAMDGKLDKLLANQSSERARRKVWTTIRTGGVGAVGALCMAVFQWWLSSKQP